MRWVSRSQAGLIARRFRGLESRTRGARHRLVAFNQAPDHVVSLRDAVVLLDRRQCGDIEGYRPAPGEKDITGAVIPDHRSRHSEGPFVSAPG